MTRKKTAHNSIKTTLFGLTRFVLKIILQSWLSFNGQALPITPQVT